MKSRIFLSSVFAFLMFSAPAFAQSVSDVADPASESVSASVDTVVEEGNGATNEMVSSDDLVESEAVSSDAEPVVAEDVVAVESSLGNVPTDVAADAPADETINTTESLAPEQLWLEGWYASLGLGLGGEPRWGEANYDVMTIPVLIALGWHNEHFSVQAEGVFSPIVIVGTNSEPKQNFSSQHYNISASYELKKKSYVLNSIKFNGFVVFRGHFRFKDRLLFSIGGGIGMIVGPHVSLVQLELTTGLEWIFNKHIAFGGQFDFFNALSYYSYAPKFVVRFMF